MVKFISLSESNIIQTLEQKALSILDTYQGSNNYILKLKQQKENNKKFFPTRAQSDYIINYHQIVPKVAKKWVDLDPYFADKLAKDNLYQKSPEQVWVEKLLVEKEKSYHIWGKVFSGQTLHEFWLPKAAIIKTEKIEKVEVDYTKYSHRPPLEHQKVAIERLVGSKRFILADDMGVGKGLENNSLIYVPNGVKKMGDIVVGDKVIGSDGNPYNVIGVFPQGKKETYKITFNDGYSIITDDEHLWSVSSPNYGKNRQNERRKKSLVLSTKQMYDGGKIIIKGDGYNKDKNYEIETYYKSPNGNNKWQIPIVQPIQFEQNNELPIEPYLLGLCLGYGYFNKNNNCVFVVHEDDYDELFSRYKLKPRKTRVKQKGGYIKIGDTLNLLNLNNTKAYNKFIPNIYKYSSIENRLAILQGLMDTDGHCMSSKNGTFKGTEFSTISEKLCDDVCEIVQTLGGIARKKSRRSFYKKDGKKVECNISYRVNIKLPKGMNPFRLKRKSERYIEPKKYPTGRYISKIEKYGEDECTCISVDSPDKLYVTEHCIVTHNTTSAIIASLETNSKRILIICPASLKLNWEREFKNYTDRSIYISEGKNFSDDHEIVIVNYDILKNFHNIKNPNDSKILNKFDVIIADECFTYDTMVTTELGKLKIGEIVEKNLDVKVLTYNHTTNETEFKKITRRLIKNNDTIYQIKLHNGVFIECTGNHKIFVKDKGYVRADQLTSDDYLYELSKTSFQKTNMEKNKNMFKIVWNKLSIQNQTNRNKRKRKKVFQKLWKLWSNDDVLYSKSNEKTNLLFNQLCCKTKMERRGYENEMDRKYENSQSFSNYERYTCKKSKFSQNVIRTDEKKQPYEKSRIIRKNEEKITWADIFIEGGGWKINNPTNFFTRNVRGGVDFRTTNNYEGIQRSGKKFTKLLQSRYRTPKIKDSDRNRWENPQNEKMEIFGQKENECIKLVRVESVKILEQGSDGKSSKLYKNNTRVYDLEIEDNHNYFANNVLVSNCHYVNNTQAQRTKLFNDFAKKVDKLWLLTGTPITSRPINYYNLLNLVNSPVAQNWMAYVIRYCNGYQFNAGKRKVWNVNGASNLEELRDRTSRQLLRRLKTDVLDLPDKIITPVYLRLKSKMYEAMMGEYFDWYKNKKDESSSLTIQFSKLMKVRQVMSEEKIQHTIEIAENVLEQDKKVIIFTNFTESLNKLVEHFGKKCVYLDGSCSKTHRQNAVDQFQENDKIKVFVGNIKAAGVGITLTQSEVVIFNDLSFVPSDHSQAEDRAFRYGQKNNVLVYYPIFENTIEGVIYDILAKKKQIVETVMGDNLDSGDIIEEMMNKINSLK